jgi:hypothetical protein
MYVQGGGEKAGKKDKKGDKSPAKGKAGKKTPEPPAAKAGTKLRKTWRRRFRCQVHWLVYYINNNIIG